MESSKSFKVNIPQILWITSLRKTTETTERETHKKKTRRVVNILPQPYSIV